MEHWNVVWAWGTSEPHQRGVRYSNRKHYHLYRNIIKRRKDSAIYWENTCSLKSFNHEFLRNLRFSTAIFSYIRDVADLLLLYEKEIDLQSILIPKLDTRCSYTHTSIWLLYLLHSFKFLRARVASPAQCPGLRPGRLEPGAASAGQQQRRSGKHKTAQLAFLRAHVNQTFYSLPSRILAR